MIKYLINVTLVLFFYSAQSLAAVNSYKCRYWVTNYYSDPVTVASINEDIASLIPVNVPVLHNPYIGSIILQRTSSDHSACGGPLRATINFSKYTPGQGSEQVTTLIRNITPDSTKGCSFSVALKDQVPGVAQFYSINCIAK